MNKQKMRAENTCGTPASEFQTEPYSASYGQKTFGGTPQNLGICFKNGKYRVLQKPLCFFTRGNLVSKKEILLSRRELLLSGRNVISKKGHPAFKKENPLLKEGILLSREILTN